MSPTGSIVKSLSIANHDTRAMTWTLFFGDAYPPDARKQVLDDAHAFAYSKCCEPVLSRSRFTPAATNFTTSYFPQNDILDSTRAESAF